MPTFLNFFKVFQKCSNAFELKVLKVFKVHKVELVLCEAIDVSATFYFTFGELASSVQLLTFNCFLVFDTTYRETIFLTIILKRIAIIAV